MASSTLANGTLGSHRDDGRKHPAEEQSHISERPELPPATKSTWEYQPNNGVKFELEQHPVDEAREFKVAVIGAGLSGIIAGALLPAKVPKINLTIFDKNTDVGGTWFENCYPGVRCDVPAHVYQSTFSPNTQWSEEYAQGPEILAYWQSVARKNNVYQYIHFQRRIERAVWDPSKSQWTLSIEKVDSHEHFTQNFDFLITATGLFNNWTLPDFPGIRDYKGHLRHSSNWDPDFDATGKNVAVIGNGASGIQVVPEMQKVAARVDHYVRNPTWIAGSLGGLKDRQAKPMPFSPQELKAFKDPEKYVEYRKSVENTLMDKFPGLFKDSAANAKLQETFREIMATRLNGRTDLLDALIPSFSPNCRRLTPGPGYLESLTKENVHFINTPIRRFTSSGIETADGTVREVDAIICATGARVDFAPVFSIIANNIDLKEAWAPGGLYGFPYTYLGIAAPDFPNLLIIHSPNSSAIAGSLVHSVENEITYASRILRKVATQGIKTIAPTKEAADDFLSYADAFFSTTVLSEECSSWYNGRVPGGRIRGLWPGSAAHANVVRREPRWEDWRYTYVNGQGNRFGWLGDGWTNRERRGIRGEEVDWTPYLKKEATAEEVDLRDWHESWWDL